MRKLILIATILLASSAAHAGAATRGLSVAAPGAVQPIEQPKAEPQRVSSVAEQLKAIGEMPAAEKPAAVPAQSTAPVAAAPAEAKLVTAAAAGPTTAAKPVATHAKPKKKQVTTEARVRRELGRYGIRW